MSAAPLTGKNVLITGGGSGIGLASAVALAGAGANVIIAGRRREVLAEAVQQIGPRAKFHEVDVADSASVNDLFQWVASNVGSIHVLINAAGVNIPLRTMRETSLADWEKVMAINATGAFLAMQAVLPQMRERGDGLIINISSVSGLRASPLGGVAYCASKFAMTALGTAVSLEDGPSGVRVTNICPGEVNTPILKARKNPVSDEHRQRILQPEDVAAAVLMVAQLPARAHIPELVIKPTWQEFT